MAKRAIRPRRIDAEIMIVQPVHIRPEHGGGVTERIKSRLRFAAHGPVDSLLKAFGVYLVFRPKRPLPAVPPRRGIVGEISGAENIGARKHQVIISVAFEDSVTLRPAAHRAFRDIDITVFVIGDAVHGRHLKGADSRKIIVLMTAHKIHVFVVVDENIAVDIQRRRIDRVADGRAVRACHKFKRTDGRIRFQDIVSLLDYVVFDIHVHVKNVIVLSDAGGIGVAQARVFRDKALSVYTVIRFFPGHQIFRLPAGKRRRTEIRGAHIHIVQAVIAQDKRISRAVHPLIGQMLGRFLGIVVGIILIVVVVFRLIVGRRPPLDGSGGDRPSRFFGRTARKRRRFPPKP